MSARFMHGAMTSRQTTSQSKKLWMRNVQESQRTATTENGSELSLEPNMHNQRWNFSGQDLHSRRGSQIRAGEEAGLRKRGLFVVSVLSCACCVLRYIHT